MLECAAAAARVMRTRRFASAVPRFFNLQQGGARKFWLVLDDLDVRFITGSRALHKYSTAILQPADTCAACSNPGYLDQLRSNRARASFSRLWLFPFHQFVSLPVVDGLLLPGELRPRLQLSQFLL